MNDKFLLCPVWKNTPIARDNTSKWFVSYEEIPRTDELYPDYCSGWLWITTPGYDTQYFKSV